ncbi:hypothetical protein [Micromonospora sp. CA-248212]|uniref:hypothetical protein n=1 Tax=Micromonospora sp. CA-248212 TaxID=3239961 RepID=UPI003D923CEE
MPNFVAALTNVSDCVVGDYCDVSVITSEVVGYREDSEGNEIPEYGMTGDVAMEAIETNVRTDGDIGDALTEADAILRNAGWDRVGEWEPSQNAYYADVRRS